MRQLAVLCATLLLAGCGAISIKPERALPAPLVQPLPAAAGLVLGAELRNYSHKETRAGADWEIGLGTGHVRMLSELLRGTFRTVETFPTLEAARTAPGLAAIFAPVIEQYSFATARDTGGRYWAVTIRYRLNVYTPAGEQADSLTLTGYGSAMNGGRSGAALERATLAAMRDAAAKFLVQFPRQQMAAGIARGEAVQVTARVAATAAVSDGIEAVPLEEPASVALPPAPVPAPPPVPPPAPAPTP